MLAHVPPETDFLIVKMIGYLSSLSLYFNKNVILGFLQ